MQITLYASVQEKETDRYDEVQYRYIVHDLNKFDYDKAIKNIETMLMATGNYKAANVDKIEIDIYK